MSPVKSRDSRRVEVRQVQSSLGSRGKSGRVEASPVQSRDSRRVEVSRGESGQVEVSRCE